MNEAIGLHGHFSEGYSKGFRPVIGKSPPLWGQQQSRTARVSLKRWEGQGIGTSHCLSSGNIHTQKQKRIWTTGPLCSRNAGWHQTVHMDIHMAFPAITKYTGWNTPQQRRECADQQDASAWAPRHDPHMPFCQCLHQEPACCHWFSTCSIMSDRSLEYLETWQLGCCKCERKKGHSFTIIRLCDFSTSRKWSLLPW